MNLEGRLSAASCLRPSTSCSHLSSYSSTHRMQRCQSAKQWNSTRKDFSNLQPSFHRKATRSVSADNILPRTTSKSALIQATLRSVRSQILLNTRTPIKSQVVRHLKQRVAKPFRSALLNFEVELCERLSECNDTTTTNPIEKRLDIVREVLIRMITEDPVLGAILTRIRDEYDRAIKELIESRDGTGRLSELSLQRLADENDHLSRKLKSSREECSEKTRKLAELSQKMELLEIDNESQKEQIIDLTNRLITFSTNPREADDDDLCRYMTGDLQVFTDQDQVPATVVHQSLAKKGLNQAEERVHILEAERGEVEEANKRVEQAVTKLAHQYDDYLHEWNQKHTALFGAAARFRIGDEDDDDDNDDIEGTVADDDDNND